MKNKYVKHLAIMETFFLRIFSVTHTHIYYILFFFFFRMHLLSYGIISEIIKYNMAQVCIYTQVYTSLRRGRREIHYNLGGTRILQE